MSRTGDWSGLPTDNVRIAIIDGRVRQIGTDNAVTVDQMFGVGGDVRGAANNFGCSANTCAEQYVNQCDLGPPAETRQMLIDHGILVPARRNRTSSPTGSGATTSGTSSTRRTRG